MEPQTIYIVSLDISGNPLKTVAAYTNLKTLRQFLYNFFEVNRETGYILDRATRGIEEYWDLPETDRLNVEQTLVYDEIDRIIHVGKHEAYFGPSANIYINQVPLDIPIADKYY